MCVTMHSPKTTFAALQVSLLTSILVPALDEQVVVTPSYPLRSCQTWPLLSAGQQWRLHTSKAALSELAFHALLARASLLSP